MIGSTTILLLILATAMSEDHLMVKTTSGSLKGRISTVLGKNVKQFLGVPYAEPPVGDLRFKPPVPLQFENRELQAYEFGPICYQPPHAIQVMSPLLTPNKSKMSEDCLYLNIYAPDIIGKIPVMVWLPGEGFNYADPTQFDGSFLAVTSKVIVVTVSYRLSVFGFLNALSQDAPGNVGLLDQRLALKWVQQNIKAFGGDPDKVTLFGRFTGAMSAAIHTFSPLSKDESLFNRVILQSGVPDGKWIFNYNPLNAATDLAETTNCVHDSLNETVACLRRLPADVLLNTALPMPNAWRPSIDFTLINQPTLLEAIKGDYRPVDILIGTNNDEGSLCLTVLSVMNSNLFEMIVNNTLPKKDFDQLLNSFVLDVYKESNQLLNNITSFMYSLNGSSIRSSFVKFCGDIYVHSHSNKLANIISDRGQNIFVYELAHRPSFSNNPSFVEAGHGDDVLYTFGFPLKLDNLPEDEKALTLRILKTMENFAYYGNPNAEGEKLWPQYKNGSHLVMRFDTHPGAGDIAKTDHEDAAFFWHNIIPAALKHDCPSVPMPSALIETDENPHIDFFGTWISTSAAEYMLAGLLFICALLLVSLLLSLIVVLRYSSSMAFQRLK